MPYSVLCRYIAETSDKIGLLVLSISGLTAAVLSKSEYRSVIRCGLKPSLSNIMIVFCAPTADPVYKVVCGPISRSGKVEAVDARKPFPIRQNPAMYLLFRLR